MNIFIIPSIYPSEDYPVSGYFFKEQATCLAKNHPEHNFGISLWGQNEISNQIWAKDHFKAVNKMYHSFKRKAETRVLLNNLSEFYEPRFTWTEKWVGGNISSIIKACIKNAHAFEHKYGKIDVIHAHVSYPAGFIALKMSEKMDVPFVITEHMSRLKFEDHLENQKKVSRKSLMALMGADKIIAVSTALQKHIFQYRLDDVVVIPNMVDETYFKPEVVNKQKGITRIFVLSNIIESKGIHELLDTIARVKRVNPNIFVRIGGTGKDLKLFLNREQILRIQDIVEWIGPLERSQVLDEMHHCDIFVSTSRHETFGLVLAEAIACGKPIVCTRCGGPEDIVNLKNGVIANPKDSVDIAKKLLFLMDHLSEYDSSVIRKDFEDRFSAKSVTPKIIDLYSKVKRHG